MQHVDYIVVFGVGVMMWKILPTHYRKGKLDGSLWMIMLGLVLLASASWAPLCIFFLLGQLLYEPPCIFTSFRHLSRIYFVLEYVGIMVILVRRVTVIYY